jgi:hypothetical protein
LLFGILREQNSENHDKLLKEGRCFYYKELGHIKPQCLKFKAVMKKKAASLLELKTKKPVASEGLKKRVTRKEVSLLSLDIRVEGIDLSQLL